MRHTWRMFVGGLGLALTACHHFPSMPAIGHGGTMHHGHGKSGPARTIEADTLPDSQSLGAKTFARYCQQCHALPDPAQHTATEWPNVVERMRGNMRSMNKNIASDLEAQSITEYLQRYAKGSAENRTSKP